VALCGGGSVPRPGEITLAHRGVLFLDELPEFSRRALESLREPLEEGSIHIARAACSVQFPANVLFVAAMNPCPCGRYKGERPLGDDTAAPCMCAFDQIQRYRTRISGPLIDRVDLHVRVEPLPFAAYNNKKDGESSNTVRQRVLRAFECQQRRFGMGRTNASMQSQDLRAHAALDSACVDALEQATASYGLSARAITRVLKVSRTIADLAQHDDLAVEHVEEALRYRILDRGMLAA